MKKHNFMFAIGDQAQAFDGRIGIVVDTVEVDSSSRCPSIQNIIVKFPDQSMMEGWSENFKAVQNRALLV